MSTSSKTTTGALPPSSRWTRLSVSAACSAIHLPVSTEPVSETMSTSSWSTSAAPGVVAAGDHVEHALGQELGGRLGELEGRQRRRRRRLEHDRVAGGQRRADLPDRHHQRVVPRRDLADDADRLAADERRVALDVLAGRLALEVARGAREEAQVVDGDGDLVVAERVDRLAGVGDLERRRARRRAPRSRRRSAAARASARRAWRSTSPASNAARAAPTARSTSARVDEATPGRSPRRWRVEHRVGGAFGGGGELAVDEVLERGGGGAHAAERINRLLFRSVVLGFERDSAVTNVVISSAARTAIGSYGKSLKDVPPTDLGATAAAAAIERAGHRARPDRPRRVRQRHPHRARRHVHGARRRDEGRASRRRRPAFTVNRLCGTGVQAIVSAAQAIQSGDVDVALAGGAESMSRGPYWMPRRALGREDGRRRRWSTRSWAALTDPFHEILMGVTAENLAERDGDHARRAGRVRGRVAPPRRAGARGRAASTTRSSRSRCKVKRETVDFDARRAHPRGRVAGVDGQAADGLQEGGRHGHRRQRVGHERRRRRASC